MKPKCMLEYDIAIIGSGPSGSCAALTLQNTNVRVALFEKEEFPRQKVCGDGLCDRSINTLRAISESYYFEFMETFSPLPMQKTDLVYKGTHYTLNFKNFGYTCKREDFDAFLFSRIQRDCSNCTIYQNTQIAEVQKHENGLIIRSTQNETFFAKMVIVANGAKSHIATELTEKPWEKEKNGVAIRAYFSGVTDTKSDTIELHYSKKYFPGYFWIFPMQNNIANVGFGYSMKDKDKHPLSIHEIFTEWIQNDGKLRERFKNAVPISKMQGGLIPYNTNDFSSAGNRYIITGDAASLIDPISGGGIGSAMYSGYCAAKTALQCVETQDFSYTQTKTYEKALKQRIQKEIRKRNRLQKLIRRLPFMLDVFAHIAKNQTRLQKISSWYFR